MQGIAIGSIRQNSVKITQVQFGDIYNKVVEYSKNLNLKKVPDVYVMQSGGILNAFATRFLFKDVVVIYSDILELAYEQGENAVNFVIAHELAHIKRGHLSKKKYIVCAEIIPFLGTAYSRACETTCDKLAAAVTGKLPLEGLLVLAAGKKLYKKVDPKLFLLNATQDKGFWDWFAEACSTHPSLVTRIKQLANMNLKRESVPCLNEKNTI
jgi:Zn-dependent protease with chaperone function